MQGSFVFLEFAIIAYVPQTYLEIRTIPTSICKFLSPDLSPTQPPTQ
jgi:hypothetical protein